MQPTAASAAYAVAAAEAETVAALLSMPHRYQDDVTRVRARDVARVSLAVLFLAFMGGAYLSAWTGLPAWLALGATLSLLSAWTVRRHRRRLQGVRDLCFHIDSEQLAVERVGRKCTIVERDQVRAITHDGDDVVAIYDERAEPVFRVRLGDLEDGRNFWQQLQSWAPIREVPRGQLSLPESIGAISVVALILAGAVYIDEPLAVAGIGFIAVGLLAWHMRPPWRHRFASRSARRVIWVAMVLSAMFLARAAFVALGG